MAFEGTTAIVTGGASGLGLAITEALVARGTRVAVSDHMAAYVASKAGLIRFTKALALELGPRGIAVNTIPPGMVVTPMLEKAIAEGNFTDSLEHFASITMTDDRAVPLPG